MSGTTPPSSTPAGTKPNPKWVTDAERRLLAWRADPCLWCKDVLGIDLTEGQKMLANSIVNNKRVVCRSANGMGKTFLAAVFTLWYCSTRKGVVLATAPTWYQVQRRLWAEVCKLYDKAKVELGGELLRDGCRWKIGPYWEASGISTRDTSNFQGGHAENYFIIFDEAQGVESGIWEAAESMMMGGKARWLAIGNPLEARGEFYRTFKRPDEWTGVTLSALDHPNYVNQREDIPGATTYEWVEERRQMWGENDPRWVARVLGEFPDMGSDRVIPPGFIETADSEGGCDIREGYHLGVDVARFGEDETVIAVVKNNILEREIRLAGADGLKVAGRVIKLARKLKIKRKDAKKRIHVDTIGVGASVVDSMRAEKWKVDAVNFAEKPRGSYSDDYGPMDFANQRAEFYWAARELFRERKVSVPSKFGSTWEELAEPGYHFNRRGDMVIEPKEEVKKRLGRSPDGADAFILALTRHVNTKPGIFLLR